MQRESTRSVSANVSCPWPRRAHPRAIGAARGTHRRIRRLYQDEYEYVKRTLERLGARGADLPDLTHDVFFIAWRRRLDYDAASPAPVALRRRLSRVPSAIADSGGSGAGRWKANRSIAAARG